YLYSVKIASKRKLSLSGIALGFPLRAALLCGWRLVFNLGRKARKVPGPGLRGKILKVLILVHGDPYVRPKQPLCLFARNRAADEFSVLLTFSSGATTFRRGGSWCGFL
ncbi:hypothetical protein, partial [Roseinatronobacter thiooxidans]|uniref:hypothetical protein n=1 Tax=Roseinatronobacter thiooxidans TaxID=121821 RepID=UPI001B8766C0